jgi:hypothetical protein
MKKIILLTVFCLAAAVSGFAQVKTLTKEQYDSAISDALAKGNKIPKREIFVTKNYSNKKPVSTTTITRENLPPDKSRWLTVTEKGGVITYQYESIKIGDTEYKKTDKGGWEKIDLNNESSNQGVLRAPALLDTKELKQFLVMDATLDNQAVKFYISYEVMVINQRMIFLDERTWINADGFIVKSATTVSDTLPDIITSQTLKSYEYNPKDLKIEAPVKTL